MKTEALRRFTGIKASQDLTMADSSKRIVFHLCKENKQQIGLGCQTSMSAPTKVKGLPLCLWRLGPSTWHLLTGRPAGLRESQTSASRGLALGSAPTVLAMQHFLMANVILKPVNKPATPRSKSRSRLIYRKWYNCNSQIKVPFTVNL